jgi:bifunctional UDP-N-acetylglucosamine pyrophosphorylase/glucosamine-1-phosphate N-acetyltransferase
MINPTKESAKAESAGPKGSTNIAELAALDAQARAATAARLMDSGVMIFRPDTTVIDPDVEVGADTVIEPFV